MPNNRTSSATMVCFTGSMISFLIVLSRSKVRDAAWLSHADDKPGETNKTNRQADGEQSAHAPLMGGPRRQQRRRDRSHSEYDIIERDVRHAVVVRASFDQQIEMSQSRAAHRGTRAEIGYCTTGWPGTEQHHGESQYLHSGAEDQAGAMTTA